MYKIKVTNKNLSSGQGIIEFIVAIMVLLFLLLGVVWLLTHFPVLVDNAVLLAIVGAFLGGIAWSIKQLLSAIVNRAQLHILEILSSGRSLSRMELKNLLNKEFFISRIYPGLEIDALQTLALSDKVVVKDNKYSLSTNSVSSKSKQKN